ncbi:hypothetical protein BN1110_05683 [bacterium YEK0313]|nr:hypothetical protein BN1110_05683 [bacterium YEK0313]
MTMLVAKLADYPFVDVRLKCTACRMERSHRLARLASAYGADRTMGEILDRLLKGCGQRRTTRADKMGESACLAHFPDLDTPTRRPDQPAALVPPRLVFGRGA